MSQFSWRVGERQVFWVCREPRLGEPIHAAVAWDHILAGHRPVSVDGGLLIEVLVPRDATHVQSPYPHIQRVRLRSGSVMVARQRERDPDGPWVLSVEFARDEEHRRRLEALQAQDGADERRAVEEREALAIRNLIEDLLYALPLSSPYLTDVELSDVWTSIIRGWSADEQRSAAKWARSEWPRGRRARSDVLPPHVMALPFHRLGAAGAIEARRCLEQHRRDADTFLREVGG